MEYQKIINLLNNSPNKLSKFRAKKLKQDNVWGVDLADMQLISKINIGIRFVLCVIDIYSKYTWVASLKNKKIVTIVNTFQKNLNDTTQLHLKCKTRKPKKV